VIIEQELRIVLNIVLTFLFLNINDDSVTQELISPNSLVEENCFKAIKYSLEISVVPIRKFLILFYIYLKSLFG
jgi:hypothetical protein